MHALQVSIEHFANYKRSSETSAACRSLVALVLRVGSDGNWLKLSDSVKQVRHWRRGVFACWSKFAGGAGDTYVPSSIHCLSSTFQSTQSVFHVSRRSCAFFSRPLSIAAARPSLNINLRSSDHYQITTTRVARGMFYSLVYKLSQMTSYRLEFGTVGKVWGRRTKKVGLVDNRKLGGTWEPPKGSKIRLATPSSQSYRGNS